ncbi:protein mono-ADP-ribosyltransferase PARP14-like [Amphiura filiformis]|uniref:protein mono-ADP-ribosyltransferase PARP14-like n=1 Tax=Amphiura filiformis TaxID=82378 RepID=UPI003B20E8EC
MEEGSVLVLKGTYCHQGAVKESDEKAIQLICKQNDVAIKITGAGNEVKFELTGRDIYVGTVHSMILAYLKQLTENKMIKERVQWKWRDEESNILQDFDDNQNADIERAYMEYQQKQSPQYFNVGVNKIDFSGIGKPSATSIKRVNLKKEMKQPDTWSDMTDDEQCKLVELQSKSSEYKQIAAEFLKSCNISSALGSPVTPTIVKIERLQNKKLYGVYVSIRDEMELRLADRSDIEQTLYHGSRKDVIDDVGKMGFDRGFTHMPTNATLYGKGTYFAKHASSSVYYAKKEDSTGNRYMYMCKVMVGEYTLAERDMYVPPKKPGSDRRYDCIVDNVTNPQIIVIFQDGQAYPEYLITFTKV